MSRLFVIIVGVLAFLVQLQSLHILMGPNPGDGMLIQYLFWQMVAALFITALYVLVWPSFFSMPSRSPLIHVFLTCWFLPVAGAALFLTEMLVQLFLKLPPDRSHLGAVNTPEFNHHLLPNIVHGVGARLLAKLTTSDAPLSGRLSAVISLRSMPLRHTSAMLLDLLADSSDEIRLLAYGTLDNAEKIIMKQVYEIEKELKLTEQNGPYTLKRRVRLAELYWELIYQHLVSGEVRTHVLGQVVSYAQQVLKQDASMAEMYYLLGRCALIRREVVAAEQFFQMAEKHLFPHDRLVPWLAEVAFAKGQYQRIPNMLKALGNSARLPQLQPLLRYWSK